MEFWQRARKETAIFLIPISAGFTFVEEEEAEEEGEEETIHARESKGNPARRKSVGRRGELYLIYRCKNWRGKGPIFSPSPSFLFFYLGACVFFLLSLSSSSSFDITPESQMLLLL